MQQLRPLTAGTLELGWTAFSVRADRGHRTGIEFQFVVSDPDLPDNPIVYKKSVFEHMTGYSRGGILGQNCRFLPGEKRDQPALEEIRAALAGHRSVELTLRNCRKDGPLFHNRLSIHPLRDSSGRLIYHLGVQHDISERANAQAGVERLGGLLKSVPQR